jgi:hypothetical protein
MTPGVRFAARNGTGAGGINQRHIAGLQTHLTIFLLNAGFAGELENGKNQASLPPRIPARAIEIDVARGDGAELKATGVAGIDFAVEIPSSGRAAKCPQT